MCVLRSDDRLKWDSVCAQVNVDIAVVQVGECLASPFVPCELVCIPLAVCDPSRLHDDHARIWHIADTLEPGAMRGVPCRHLGRVGGIGFQPVLDVRAHLWHGDVGDSELVESIDGSVEEAIRVCPRAVIVCL